MDIIGIFKRQLDTWARSRGFHTRIIGRIRDTLEERIAKERNTCAESTMGYTDCMDALRLEFGMAPDQADSQFSQNLASAQEDACSQAN